MTDPDRVYPCILCGDPVVAGEDKIKWGMGWRPGQMVHYHCADTLADASCRVRFLPERATLEARLEAAERDMAPFAAQIAQRKTYAVTEDPGQNEP